MEYPLHYSSFHAQGHLTGFGLGRIEHMAFLSLCLQLSANSPGGKSVSP
ncbi:MAG: hypothetical protein OEM58_12390 [Nitrospirota bacterium]|nr:hypothetical protein [Nitrospirota bacterium]